MLDKIIRSENGGCNPFSDSVIKLKARMDSGVIQVYVVGKWRNIRYYVNRKTMPGKKIMEEVKRIVMMNTGWKLDKEVVFNFVE
jgi:hypothetical protein